MFKKLKKRATAYLIRNFVLQRKVQEDIERNRFFYNAFRALTFNGIDGDYLEFGSHSGVTFGMAYHEAKQHQHGARLWAFDSFQGLPDQQESKDEHPKWQEGRLHTSLERFHKICRRKGVPRQAYEVVPGFYEDSLKKFGPNDAPANVALAYIDCDLYSSTKEVLAFLEPRLKHGMIIAFDDYYCWSETQASGERRAMLEMLGDHPKWRLVPYHAFGWHGQSFFVESKAFSLSAED